MCLVSGSLRKNLNCLRMTFLWVQVMFVHLHLLYYFAKPYSIHEENHTPTTRPDENTGSSVSCYFRVRKKQGSAWVLLHPTELLAMKSCETGLTVLSSLAETTRKSNHLYSPSQPLGSEWRNAPLGDGERCVTPSRAAAKETKPLADVVTKAGLSTQLLKTLNVGPARLQTHDLPHGGPTLNQLS